MHLLALLACNTDDTLAPDVASADEPIDAAAELDVGIQPGLEAQGVTTLLGVAYPTDAQRVVEIDARGRVVWEFVVPAEWIEAHSTDDRVPVVADVTKLDSGNVLFVLSPGGLFEVDPDGAVVWQHLDDRPSHDVDVLDNGNLLFAATWAARGEAQIVEITRDGEDVWSWTGESAFADTTLGAVADEGGAWMHITNIDRLDDGTTRATLRNFNMVVDILADGSIAEPFTFQSQDGKYADTEGPVVGERPHGTDWLGDDAFVTATRRPDRVIQIEGSQVTWEYSSPDLGTIRDVDRLPGGNTLVAGYDRIVELDADGRIVWQWNVPQSAMPDQSHLKPLMAVSRLDVDGVSVDLD